MEVVIWIFSVLGIIVVGIGLGNLLYYLFWQKYAIKREESVPRPEFEEFKATTLKGGRQIIAEKRSIWLPVLISLFVSLGVIIALWWLKDSPVKEYVLIVTLLTSLAIFILFILYFLAARIFLILKKPIWLSGIPGALIIYLGAIIISLSYFKDLVGQMDWDLNMVGLGMVVIVIGMSIIPRPKPPEPEETLKELKARSDDLGDKVAVLGKTQSNLGELVDSVSQETQRFLESLAKLLKESRNKGN